MNKLYISKDALEATYRFAIDVQDTYKLRILTILKFLVMNKKQLNGIVNLSIPEIRKAFKQLDSTMRIPSNATIAETLDKLVVYNFIRKANDNDDNYYFNQNYILISN